jgi:hypothetical protein
MAKTTQTAGVARTKRPQSGAAARTARTARPARPETARPEQVSNGRPHEGVSLTIPQPIVDIVMAPFAIAGRVLPAKKGLPLYAGLGVLAVAEIIEWPIAAGIGIGYAAIRRWGPQGELATRAQRGGRGGRQSQK